MRIDIEPASSSTTNTSCDFAPSNNFDGREVPQTNDWTGRSILAVRSATSPLFRSRTFNAHLSASNPGLIWLTKAR